MRTDSGADSSEEARLGRRKAAKAEETSAAEAAPAAAAAEAKPKKKPAAKKKKAAAPKLESIPRPAPPRAAPPEGARALKVVSINVAGLRSVLDPAKPPAKREALAALVAGRRELCAIVQRTRYKEVLERKLAGARLRHSSLPVPFHVRDLCALGQLAIRQTASGPFVRLVRAA